MFTVRAYCLTHTGYVRAHNEDNFSFNKKYMRQEHQSMNRAIMMQELTEKQPFFGLFDGMGGEAAGDLASYVAAKYMSIYPLQPPYTKERITRYIQMLNDGMGKVKAQGRYNTMGATLTMLYFEADHLCLANLGDSAIYRIRAHEMTKLSVDHTDEEFLRQIGIKRKPTLTQYLGVDTSEFVIEPYVEEQGLVSQDIYLMCSDGLTDMVEDARILDIITSNPMSQVPDLLVQEALQNGGKDNVTVLLCQII